jgi:predicted DNA-binding transcriptional regulator YafY
MSETTSRVLALLSLLQTHRQWSGADLSRRLGITGRTLRRDVDRLRELGYRVEATRGAGGGYRLEAGSQLPPLLLTDEEAVTMAIGLRLAATQGLTDGEHTTLSALAKFEQVLPSGLRRRVNALGEYINSQTPRGALVSAELLGQLALACRDRERVRFHYIAADGAETRRVVEPKSVVTVQRTWFLVCWDLDRVDWRTFRVDRMSRFVGTGLRFEPRELPNDDPAAFVAASISSFRQRHHAEVILKLPMEQMRRQFGYWSRDATAVDAEHTSWPLGGESMEALLSALAWIPAGVDYELRGSPEFLMFVNEAAGRMRVGARH